MYACAASETFRNTERNRERYPYICLPGAFFTRSVMRRIPSRFPRNFRFEFARSCFPSPTFPRLPVSDALTLLLTPLPVSPQ